jgi:hypothetical protein
VIDHAQLIALAGLGAYHGLNPAMGWLFAVSQGLQHGERRAVVRALGPIALGHELAIVLAAVLVLGLGELIDPGALHVGAAAVLVAFGVWRFARPHWHPRWTTMRVNGRELTLWSFMMSSAHGAGLMITPILLGGSVAQADGTGNHALAADMPIGTTALGVMLHVGAMLAVMGVIAIVVYERVGVEVLRRAWLNTDQLWAGAFIAAGVLTLFT